MNDDPVNIIRNVLVSAGDNYLRLADISFDDKIIDVIHHSDRKIHWSEIKQSKEKIIKLDNYNSQHTSSQNIFEGNYNLLMPGAVDAHVHFNTPGYESREDFQHASLAAAFGGVTTIIDMPCTSVPPVTNKNNFEYKLQSLKNKSVIDFCFYGGISGNDFDKDKVKQAVNELSALGTAGFKAYLISGMETFGDLSLNQMEEAARIIKDFDSTLLVHAEDKNRVNTRTADSIKSNDNSWNAYCKSRDVEAETKAVRDMINIAGLTGCRIHIVHLSSGEALELIRNAKEEGIKISTETCPHYLYFTQEDFKKESISNFLKTAPPVKFENDRDALWKGLADGTIEFVTTDHAGCNPEEEKSSENFWEVYGGIPGVEHRVPFLFSEGFLKDKLSLEKTIDLLSTKAAAFFKIPGKGNFINGSDADFTLVDLWKPNIVASAKMHSKGKYTPFEGITFNVSVINSFVRGRKILDENNSQLVSYGYGKYLPILN
ncbi:MAG: allantoinase AllB [Melioribacteraceae bacterium]|nr:allantoinase AllB [Melioribacteraceae bacterium]MCF8353715.1 allantoinase AllB [Melioribacteraceae bacterium]MCF8394968.1 allantoinase AllB [Melioribacteraceae bacterium]MCF8418631.1 allantoinase AllB [Melioribacteraceae bacterium]